MSEVPPSADTVARSVARTIILEFVGGSWDGRNLSNDTMDPYELELAATLYLATGNGSPGTEFNVLRDYATALTAADCRPDTQWDGAETEAFRVTNRTEVDGEILVRAEHAGS